MSSYLAGASSSISYDKPQASAMSQYDQYSNQPETFLRLFGVNVATFDLIFNQLAAHLHQLRQARPPKSRGGRPSKLPLSERLALTLFYLRGYETLLKLACHFSISEGYASKMYNQTANLLVKVLKLPSRTSLSAEALGAVIIDATEQPIERPSVGQRAYYSGKKKTHRQDATAGQPEDRADPGCALCERADT